MSTIFQLSSVFVILIAYLTEVFASTTVNYSACLEPKTPGICGEKLLRYAYDHKSGKCTSFYYSGCASTQNNFHTYEECRRDCMKKLRY